MLHRSWPFTSDVGVNEYRRDSQCLGVKLRDKGDQQTAKAYPQAMEGKLGNLDLRVHQGVTQGSSTLPINHTWCPTVAALGITLCPAQGQALQQSSVPSQCTFSTFWLNLQIQNLSHWFKKRSQNRHHLVTHYTFIVHFHNLDAPQNWGHGVREWGAEDTGIIGGSRAQHPQPQHLSLPFHTTA